MGGWPGFVQPRMAGYGGMQRGSAPGGYGDFARSMGVGPRGPQQSWAGAPSPAGWGQRMMGAMAPPGPTVAQPFETGPNGRQFSAIGPAPTQQIQPQALPQSPTDAPQDMSPAGVAGGGASYTAGAPGDNYADMASSMVNQLRNMAADRGVAMDRGMVNPGMMQAWQGMQRGPMGYGGGGYGGGGYPGFGGGGGYGYGGPGFGGGYGMNFGGPRGYGGQGGRGFGGPPRFGGGFGGYGGGFGSGNPRYSAPPAAQPAAAASPVSTPAPAAPAAPASAAASAVPGRMRRPAQPPAAV